MSEIKTKPDENYAAAALMNALITARAEVLRWTNNVADVERTLTHHRQELTEWEIRRDEIETALEAIGFEYTARPSTDETS